MGNNLLVSADIAVSGMKAQAERLRIIAENMAEAAGMLNRYNLTYAMIGTPKTAEIYNLNICIC